MIANSVLCHIQACRKAVPSPAGSSGTVLPLPLFCCIPDICAGGREDCFLQQYLLSRRWELVAFKAKVFPSPGVCTWLWIDISASQGKHSKWPCSGVDHFLALFKDPLCQGRWYQCVFICLQIPNGEFCRVGMLCWYICLKDVPLL